MTPQNFAKHRNNPNMAFWKMLKHGNDHFEVTRLEPKVNVCEKHYVFDAEPPANSTAAALVQPGRQVPGVSKCPEEIAAAVHEKQRQRRIPDRRTRSAAARRSRRSAPAPTAACIRSSWPR